MASIAHLHVEIKGTNYGVETFYATHTGLKVVRLTKADGTTYDVQQGPDRLTCDCPDFQKRHACLPYSDGCKHCRAMVEIGLVSQVTPFSPLDETAQEPILGVSGDWLDGSDVQAPANAATGTTAAFLDVVVDSPVAVSPAAPLAPSARATQQQATDAGLALAIAELAGETGVAVDGPVCPVVKARRGRPRMDSSTINWSSLGRRYAAGESYRSLATEVGVKPTRLLDRMGALGYRSPRNRNQKVSVSC